MTLAYKNDFKEKKSSASFCRTTDGCHLESTNGSHSTCSCLGLSNYALTLVQGGADGSKLSGPEGDSKGADGLSGLSQTLLAVGLSLAVVAFLLAAALCYVCIRARVRMAIY